MLSNLIPTLRYVGQTLAHKAYVFRAGLWTGAPLWRLAIHDWTKLTPTEAPHYGRQLFGDRSDPVRFEMAWNHHQNSNPHHWEYWIPWSCHMRGGWSDRQPLPMPESFVREMLADWFGASRQFTGAYPTTLAGWTWWQSNKDRIQLHPDTRSLLERIMTETFARKG